MQFFGEQGEESQPVVESAIIFKNYVANKVPKDGIINLEPINIYGKTDAEIIEAYKPYLTKENVGKYILFSDDDEYVQRDNFDDYIIKQIINDDITGKTPLISAVNRGKGFVIIDEINKNLRKARQEKLTARRRARINNVSGYYGGKKSRNSKKYFKKTSKKLYKR